MNYPALELLTQGYLTLDWPDDYADVWAAVDDYVANEPVAHQLSDEVAELIEATPSEAGLNALLIGALGSGYQPQVDGFTTTGWLLAVCERVRVALDG